jgi:hypothetical protein
MTTTQIETLREQGAQLKAHANAAVNFFSRLFVTYGLEVPGPDSALVDPNRSGLD